MKGKTNIVFVSIYLLFTMKEKRVPPLFVSSDLRRNDKTYLKERVSRCSSLEWGEGQRKPCQCWCNYIFILILIVLAFIVPETHAGRCSDAIRSKPMEKKLGFCKWQKIIDVEEYIIGSMLKFSYIINHHSSIVGYVSIFV